MNFRVLIIDEEHLLNDLNTMDHISARKEYTSKMLSNGSFEFRLAIERPMNNEISPTKSHYKFTFFSKFLSPII